MFEPEPQARQDVNGMLQRETFQQIKDMTLKMMTPRMESTHTRHTVPDFCNPSKLFPVVLAEFFVTSVPNRRRFSEVVVRRE